MNETIIAISCLSVPTFATATETEAHKKAISELSNQWDAALNAGTPEALLDLVTDDFARVAPEQPASQGKTAFLEVIKPYFAKFRFEISRRVIEEVKFEDNRAHVKGSWSGTMVPLSGDAPYLATAKWANVCERRADGSFKIASSESSIE